MNKTITEDKLSYTGKIPERVSSMIGKTYGRLAVEEYAGKNYRGVSYVRCHCSCGNRGLFSIYHILNGRSTSCGCYKLELHTKRLTKHGFAPFHGKRRTEYHVWKGMKNRCYDKNNKRYDLYGGRGISICERWLGENGFTNFLEDMGETVSGMSIERKDNDGNYCPENCVWIPLGDQAKNRRYNWKIILNQEIVTGSEMARRIGCRKQIIDKRMRSMGLDKSIAYNAEDIFPKTSYIGRKIVDILRKQF